MLSTEFTAFNKAIEYAGEILMHYFGKQLQLTHKSTSADYRTKADVESEKVIIKAIEQLFPTYNIFAEESGTTDKGSPYTFIIDPLDGTNNFVLGIPVFTSSVALMKDNEIVYGVIHCPVTKDTYYAVKNLGAFCNDNPIHVNNESNPENSTFTYFCNYLAPKERFVDFKSRLLSLDIRRFLDLWAPAFSLCSLASGKIEAIINDKIELYDYAAGKLIAMEAGAMVTDFEGNSFSDDNIDTFIITNGTPEIHQYVLNELPLIYQSRAEVESIVS